MTFLAFPDIVPPNAQTKFESFPGYEWAYRLTTFFKEATTDINNGNPGGGGAASITATDPIVVTPSPITGIGDVEHSAKVAAGTYGDASHYTAGHINAFGHYDSISALPLPSINVSNLTLFFGDGSDGAVTLDGSSTPSWATRSGSVYTMTDTCMCTDLTINVGVTLKPVGFSVFVRGTLTVNGSIRADGADGVFGASGSGTVFQSWWTAGTTLGVGFGGHAGSTGNAGHGGDAIKDALGGAGGKGGDGTSGFSSSIGGAGGVANRPVVAFGGERFAATAVFFQTSGYANVAGEYYQIAGGGGGGAGDAVNAGGAGGDGAAALMINAHIIAGTGTLSAVGGKGTNGAAGATGGGGGGGGGVICVLTTTINYQSILVVLVTAGAGGLKGGAGGQDGDAGVNGRIISVFVIP